MGALAGPISERGFVAGPIIKGLDLAAMARWRDETDEDCENCGALVPSSDTNPVNTYPS